MQDSTIPMTLFAILESFRGCFTSPSFGNFASLVLGWVICPGRHTITRVVQAAGHAVHRHHSVFHRFFAEARWLADDLSRALFSLLLPALAADILVIFDDTLAHRTGPHVFGAGMHHDAVASTYGRGSAKGRKVCFAFGHNWVVLSVFVALPWNRRRGLALPLMFRLYRSKKLCPKELYKKRTLLAREMLDLLLSWLPSDRRLMVVGDSEYACQTLAGDLPDNVHFTGPLAMDAAIFEPVAKETRQRGRGRPRKKGKRLPSPKAIADLDSVPWTEATLFLYGRDVTILVKTITCLWYTVTGTRLVRVVVTRDPSGRLDDRAFFCTDTDRTVEEVLVTMSRRWPIEVSFRNGKQILGVQDPQNGWWRRKSGTPRPPKKPGPNPHATRGAKAATRTFPFACIVYSIVVAWYLQHGNPARDVRESREEAPWYNSKSSISVMDMLVTLRRECWAARLSADPLWKRLPAKIRPQLPRWFLAA